MSEIDSHSESVEVQPAGSATAACEAESAEMTEAERREAHRYHRISLRLTLTDLALDLAYMTVMALFVAVPLDRWLAGNEWLSGEQSLLRLGALFVIVYGLHMLVSLPLSFYDGFVVEHRFGLSNQSLGRWLRNYSLRNALGAAFGLVMYAGLFWMIWQTGAYWWLVAAGAFFVVSVIMGQLAPVLIMPLFYKVERLDDERLQERMRRLADGTGLNLEGVYRLGLGADTKKANAMLAGIGRTRRVLMGDTLLEKFSLDEIEVIFAHEIGHHVHRHIPKLLAIGAVSSVAGFWLCDRLLTTWLGVPTAAEMPVAALPALMLILTLFMLVLQPVTNGISRHFERQCDRYALVRGGKPEAYRSAFRKLARINKAELDPPPLEVFLLHSHPPLSERIAMADG